MRFRSLSHCVIAALATAAWSHTAYAEHAVATFPNADDAASTQPRPLGPQLPQPPPPSEPTGQAPELLAASTAPNPNRDVDASAAERRRKAWILSVEGVTHAPIDIGIQVGGETPQGLRLSGGYGWVPGSYMNLLTGIAANASGNSYAQALLNQAQYQGHTWRAQIGWRPFRAIGLYGDVGYAQLSAKGSLDLASSGIPKLAMFGGGYTANTRLDMWLVELGYQGELADRVVLALALGAMGTFNSTTSITAVNGAPTNNAILNAAAAQADTALEKYGVVPTLTLRLGFDLI
jgi:hypothetical protein